MMRDQGYTKQRELSDCDAFSISHEGSFSLMVNLQALGILAKCYGGHALHSKQSVAEQGTTRPHVAATPKWSFPDKLLCACR